MFSVVLPDDWQRIALVALIAVMPLSTGILMTSPAFQNWSGLLVASLLSALLATSAWSGAAVRVRLWTLPLTTVCFLAHPLAVLLLPLHVLAAGLGWRRRDYRLVGDAAVLGGLAIIAAVWGLMMPKGPEFTGTATTMLWDVLWKTPLYAIDRGFGSGLIGSELRTAIIGQAVGMGNGSAPGLWYAACALLLLLLAWLAWRRLAKAEGVFVGALAFIILALSFLVLASNASIRHIPAETFLLKAARYWYLQQVFSLLAVGMVVLAWVRTAPKTRTVGVAVAAMLLTHLANIDDHIRYARRSLAGDAAGDPTAEATAQRAFLEQAEAARRAGVACIEQSDEHPAPHLRLTLKPGAALQDCVRY